MDVDDVAAVAKRRKEYEEPRVRSISWAVLTNLTSDHRGPDDEGRQHRRPPLCCISEPAYATSFKFFKDRALASSRGIGSRFAYISCCYDSDRSRENKVEDGQL